MKRPLVIALAYLVAGIGIGRLMFNHWALLPCALLVAAAVFLTVGLYKTFKTVSVWAFPVLFLFGLSVTSVNLSPRNMLIESWANLNSTVKVDATVADVSKTEDGYRVFVNTKSIQNITYPDNIIRQKIKLVIFMEGKKEPSIGQQISFSGTLSPLSSPRNPGDFDEFTYYRSRKVQYKVYVDRFTLGDVSVTPDGIISSLRQRLAYIYDSVLPPRQAGLMKTMILGDRSGLESDMQQLFADSGIYHIVVVSGTHVTIVVFGLYSLLKVFLRQKQAAVVSIIALFLYCWLVGFGVAVTRAGLMCLLALLTDITPADVDKPTGAALAAFVLLIYEPLYLFDSGFLYSFTGLLGLMFLEKPLGYVQRRYLESVPFIGRFFKLRYVAKYLPSCAAAMLATTPVCMYFYYQMPTYALIANLIIAGNATILIILGLIVGVLGLINLTAAAFISGTLYVLLNLYEDMCRIITSIPFATIITGRPDILSMIGMAGILIVGTWIYYDKKPLNRKIFGALCAVALVVALVPVFLPQQLSIALLDVGQGDCVVFYRNHRAVIVDGGGVMGPQIGENVGVTVLVPFLKYQGITTVEAVYVSHLDADHSTGIIELTADEQFHIKKVVLSALPYGSDKLLGKLTENCNIRDIPIEYMNTLDTDEYFGVKFTCLFSDEPVYGNDENRSLGLSAQYGDVKMLLCGDIPSNMEAFMLFSDVDLSASILKLNHHGSKSSNSMSFLSTVNPVVSVVSAGSPSLYNHPNPETKARLRELGIPLYNTFANGAIIIETDGKTFSLEVKNEQ